MEEIDSIVTPVAGRHAILEERAVFELTGPDRVRYLNGQVTNDVSKDLASRAIAACVCNLKGKVEHLVWIRSEGDSLWIDGPREQRESLHERLDRYLIADDCELHDRTDSGVLVHHYLEDGPGIPSLRTEQEGRDCWIPSGQDLPFEESGRISRSDFETLQWKAGIPRFPTEISGNEFPAELGIESWTVDFHKGCYLGQEVISRIQSVGRVKRRLCRVIANKPFDQNSLLRNSRNEALSATGPDKEISKKIHLGFAWLKDLPSNLQELDIQQVEVG